MRRRRAEFYWAVEVGSVEEAGPATDGERAGGTAGSIRTVRVRVEVAVTPAQSVSTY
jgi:uncharacterized protein (DUF736 family)